MNKRRLLLVASVVFTALCIGLMVKLQQKPRPPLPVLHKVEGPALTGTDGQPLAWESLKGKVWVTDFIFTTCGSICPTMTKHMAQLWRSYRLMDKVNFVSISVNPEYDTPEVLKVYAQKNGVHTPEWYFLTGSREDITTLAVRIFKLGSVEEPIFHSSYFVLVDQNGFIRGYYDGLDSKRVGDLFQDIAHVLKEEKK